MLSKIVDIFAGKLAEVIVTSVTTTIENSFATLNYKLDSYRLDRVQSDLNAIEAELRRKPRITEDEAIDIARRINDARSKL